MTGRFALALSFSAVAHAGLAWMVGDRLPSSAAPAQRALTVALTPAAPRAVLNSIAPSATAVLSPVAVQSLAPVSVPVIDEPDRVLAARIAAPVEWSSGANVGDLQQRPVRLHFRLRACKLFAFHFVAERAT